VSLDELDIVKLCCCYQSSAELLLSILSNSVGGISYKFLN